MVLHNIFMSTISYLLIVVIALASLMDNHHHDCDGDIHIVLKKEIAICISNDHSTEHSTEDHHSHGCDDKKGCPIKISSAEISRILVNPEPVSLHLLTFICLSLQKENHNYYFKELHNYSYQSPPVQSTEKGHLPAFSLRGPPTIG